MSVRGPRVRGELAAGQLAVGSAGSVSLPEDGLFLVYSMGKRAPLGARSYGVPIAH